MMQSTIAIVSLHLFIKIVIELSQSVYLGWAGLKIALSMTFCYIMDSTSKVVRIVAPLQVKVRCYQITIKLLYLSRIMQALCYCH